MILLGPCPVKTGRFNILNSYEMSTMTKKQKKKFPCDLQVSFCQPVLGTECPNRML